LRPFEKTRGPEVARLVDLGRLPFDRLDLERAIANTTAHPALTSAVTGQLDCVTGTPKKIHTRHKKHDRTDISI